MKMRQLVADLLHWATHRIPGEFRAHRAAGRPPGTAATAARATAPPHRFANHSPARPPPRPMVAWQTPDRASVRSGAVDEGGGAARGRWHPRYEDFPDPVAGDGEVIIDVKAVAVENVDKAHRGRHALREPAVHSASCRRSPPSTASAHCRTAPRRVRQPRPPYGALAEESVVPKGSYMPIPEGIDPAVATVHGRTAITGMSIKTAAGFMPGETVLIQGATGVAGRLAVKVAGCSAPDGSS